LTGWLAESLLLLCLQRSEKGKRNERRDTTFNCIFLDGPGDSPDFEMWFFLNSDMIMTAVIIETSQNCGLLMTVLTIETTFNWSIIVNTKPRWWIIARWRHLVL
jgi:hypothetical protein